MATISGKLDKQSLQGDAFGHRNSRKLQIQFYVGLLLILLIAIVQLIITSAMFLTIVRIAYWFA